MDQELQKVLLEIHKQLVQIAQSLRTLETVARHEHPDAFRRPERPATPPLGGRK